jgi:osmotically-inducible protein OsmY
MLRRMLVLALWCALLPAAAAGAMEASDQAMAEAEVTDQDLVAVLEQQLRGHEAVPADRVDVAAENGVVTLSGRVDSLLAKEAATRVARSLRGVRAVVNTVEVAPGKERDPGALRSDVEQALTQDPATEAYEVAVEVEAGRVTLTGTVDSWQERILAEAVAKGVRGVRSLENALQVRYGPDRPDDEIRADVRRTLDWDVWVNAEGVTVRVLEGTVFLDGVVGSAAQRERAYQDAWVSGVGAVDHSDLRVDWTVREAQRRRTPLPEKDDQAVARAVRDALARDPRVAVFDVRAQVEDGVAVLSGTVDNLAAKRAAEHDARNTVGVWNVRNHVRVRPEQDRADAAPGDAETADNVRAALRRNPMVDASRVVVRVENGKAFLHGEVASRYAREQAGNAAERARGVAALENALRVDAGWSPAADWAIREDVQSAFFWSPFVDGGDIDVRVDKGVVTLDGVVDSRAEQQMAAQKALQAGARRVRLHLEIRGREG